MEMHMRAAVLETPGAPLRLHDDVAIRPPRAGEVRVRVAYCGVCHSDLSIVDGTFPSPLPIVLGHEASGVVDAAGEGVAGLAVGDHVILTPITTVSPRDRPVVPSGKALVWMPAALAHTPGSPRTHQ